jgi:hypothetical protein
MKRLVLLGEGHGELQALPILVKKILRERYRDRQPPLYDYVVRTRNPTGLIKWDKELQKIDYSRWIDRVALAARHSEGGGILAVFDGDAKQFPAGSLRQFCAATVAKEMSRAASVAGAGKICSLAVVFACVEYETWIIAGLKSLIGKSFSDGRPVIRRDVRIPEGDAESHGKSWLEKNCPGYRPTRDQSALTELLNLDDVRAANLRSYSRLENAIGQLTESMQRGVFVSTPT